MGTFVKKKKKCLWMCYHDIHETICNSTILPSYNIFLMVYDYQRWLIMISSIIESIEGATSLAADLLQLSNNMIRGKKS